MKTSRHLQANLSGLSGFVSSLGASQAFSRRKLWIWFILGALVLGAVGWFVHHSVEETLREHLASELTTILGSDVDAIRIWTKDQKTIAHSLARSSSLRPLVQELLAISKRPNVQAADFFQAKALVEVRSLFAPFLKDFGYVDFFIISPSMEVVASNTDAPIKSVLDGYRREFCTKVLHEGPSVSRPFPATMLLVDSKGELKAGLPTMYAASPIQDEGGQPLAVFALRIRPEVDFTEILQTRFGESGETYAFSETGLLLSQSRFDEDLKRLGLLPDLPDAQSILTVEVRDPQVNLMEGKRSALSRANQPLNQMVTRAVSGEDGVDLQGHRDYRGVPSLGAWKWLPEYGFGVATEVDIAEAFRPLYILRRAIWSLFGLLLLCAGAVFFSMILMARQQRRAEKAEKTIKQLGQYTLEDKIGAGGMGTVYQARHAFLKRPTAVKILDPDKVTEESFARFEREVQLTSRLNHPNTIAVFDYGQNPDGVCYYAMEYLDGINLDDLIKDFGPLPEGRVIEILRQMCGSLAEAHDIGLIHRDIKPANVILTCRAGIPDFVKVLDFGLVKVVDESEEAKLTRANVTVGTPHYLSPEAVERPESVTPLSDLYAIGALGYFLLTGTTVFTGKTIMEICMKHVRTNPDAPSVRLGRPVSPGLEELILRCLAKNPVNRPTSTRSLLKELSQLEISPGWTLTEAEKWWASYNYKKSPGTGKDDSPTEKAGHGPTTNS